MRSAPGEV